MWDKFRKALYEVCDIMEIFMAVAVVVGIIIATISLYPGLLEYWNHRTQPGAFLEFLDIIFNVVIGIEFMKMLCRPSSANIIEALIFLMARHMIIQTTTAQQDLLSVISICILFLFRRFMLATKPGHVKDLPKLFQAIRFMQSPEFEQMQKKSEAAGETTEKETVEPDCADDFRADDMEPEE